MNDSLRHSRTVAGIAPKARGRFFSQKAPVGWRYAAGARQAERLDYEELIWLNEQACRQQVRSALEAKSALLAANPAKTARPVSGFELVDLANSLNDVRLLALDDAIKTLQVRLLPIIADYEDYNTRNGERTQDAVRNLQTRLDHIVSELGEKSLADRRRLRQLTTEVLALHNSQSVEAVRENSRLDALQSNLNRLELTTQTLSDSLDLVSDTVRPRATLVASMASSLEKSNIAPALTNWGPIFVRSSDLIGATLLKTGQWDSHLLPAIDAAAQNGGVAVDAGAHFGIVSCILSTKFRAVHAFEANSETFKILSLNAFLRENILTHNLALSDREGTQSLSVAEEQDLGARSGASALDHSNVGSLSFSRRGDAALPVRGVPLDSLKLDNVGFMKIDCQGADGLVLLGARETLLRCRPHIVFEWEAELAKNYGLEFENLNSFLSNLGYEVSVLFVHNHKQTDFVAKPKVIAK